MAKRRRKDNLYLRNLFLILIKNFSRLHEIFCLFCVSLMMAKKLKYRIYLNSKTVKLQSPNKISNKDSAITIKLNFQAGKSIRKYQSCLIYQSKKSSIGFIFQS